MGYNTDFSGELKFKDELKASEITYLNQFLRRDRRDIGYGEGQIDEYWYHINLEFLDDYSGLTWDGSEKTYGMKSIINFLTDRMKEKFTTFELTGELLAQGEDMDDRYTIKMVDGVATECAVVITGDKIQCPNCEEYFYLK